MLLAEFLETVYADMEASGTTFDDVVKIPKYILDQREYTMKTIRSLRPDFEPTPIVRDYAYTCRLFNKIDTKKPCSNPSPAQDLCTAADLRERLSEQLTNEVDGNIEIKSIDKAEELTPWVTFCVSIKL